MTIPATINVCGVPYSTKIKDRITEDGQNCDGLITYNCALIEIVDGMPLQVERRILLHEIVHACFEATGHNKYRRDEDLVCAVANTMVQLLQSNPELVKYLTECTA